MHMVCNWTIKKSNCVVESLYVEIIGEVCKCKACDYLPMGWVWAVGIFCNIDTSFEVWLNSE